MRKMLKSHYQVLSNQCENYFYIIYKKIKFFLKIHRLFFKKMFKDTKFMEIFFVIALD